jgi:hypothetical protein
VAVADAYTTEATREFGTPPVDVAALYVPTLDYVVTAMFQTSRIRPRDGLDIPTIEVHYLIPGLPGDHYIRIDNYAFSHADVLAYMTARVAQIRAIFALDT